LSNINLTERGLSKDCKTTGQTDGGVVKLQAEVVKACIGG
jgi:hypothetical protein